MPNCEACDLYKNCPIKELVVQDPLTPASVLAYKNNVLNAPISNFSSKQIYNRRGVAERVCSVQVFGKGDEAGTVIDPRKAIIECNTLLDTDVPSWQTSALNFLTGNRRKKQQSNYRKTLWSNEIEAMKDYSSALNDYISSAWLFHLSRIDNDSISLFDKKYCGRNLTFIGLDVAVESDVDRKLYKMGYHQGIAMVNMFTQSLNLFMSNSEEWHSDKFLQERLVRVEDCVREGLARTDLSEYPDANKVQELLTIGAESQGLISGPLAYMHELYNYINPHEIAAILTHMNANDMSTVVAQLGADVVKAGHYHHTDSSRPIPNMPLLSHCSPGIDDKVVKEKYGGKSYVCPAHHARTRGCRDFLNRVINTYYQDPEQYPRVHAFANGSETTVTSFSNMAVEARSLFMELMIKYSPLFKQEALKVSKAVKQNSL